MKTMTDYKSAIDVIQNDLRAYLKNHPIKSLVLGISGGIDSALVAALVKPIADEFNIPLIGRFLSIESNKQEEVERARWIGKLFCTDYEFIDLTKEYNVLKDIDLFEKPLKEDERTHAIRMGNIKARMRMIYLYNVASANNGMTLSTDNRTEYLLGFWTINGDVGDYAPIMGLWKTEVYEMTKYIADRETFEKAAPLYEMLDAVATDGLGITSSDLDQILPDWKERHSTTRTGYGEVDEILNEFISTTPHSFSGTSSQYNVIKRHLASEFKRNHPYCITREKFSI
jgi:NAD+ synthetase